MYFLLYSMMLTNWRQIYTTKSADVTNPVNENGLK